MAAPDRAWLLLEEWAQRYQKLAARARLERDAWVLRIAASTLERAAYALLTGRADRSLLDDLRMVEVELARRRLPTTPLRDARRILASRLRRVEPSLVTWEAADMLGLPA